MQGSLSNELDEQTFNGAAGELNGLFTQAVDATAATAVENFTTGIARFASLVDGRHAFTLGDLRAVIGSKTFALYAGTFANANKGDVSLFDYLSMHLGSIRVSDRVPAVHHRLRRESWSCRRRPHRRRFTSGARFRSPATRSAGPQLAASRSSRPRWSARYSFRTARARPLKCIRNSARPMETFCSSVEIRETATGPMLVGTVLQEGTRRERRAG